MKILLVNKFLYKNGGSETYLFGIGEALAAAGHEVQYFGMEHEKRTLENHAQSYTQNMSFQGGSKLSKLTYPFKIIYSTESREKIRKVLEDFRPDVVHLNNINFQITPSIIDEIKAFDPSVRIIYTAHDSQWVCPNHLMRVPSTGELCQRCIDGAYENCAKYRCIHDSKLQSILGTIEARYYRNKRTYEKVDTVIAPSYFMKRVLEHNPAIKDRIIVLHNAVEIPASSGAGAGKDEAQTFIDDHGLKKRGYAAFFGRFDAEKGILTMLKACREHPEITFAFAGSGMYEEEIKKLENAVLVGFLTGQTLMNFIADAAFAVIPSECYENCPYSVIEAQVGGTPVIASDIGGIPELILTKNNSKYPTGAVFAHGSFEELSSLIGRFWSDKTLCETYRDNCIKLKNNELELKFDNMNEYCDKLLKIYKGEYYE